MTNNRCRNLSDGIFTYENMNFKYIDFTLLNLIDESYFTRVSFLTECYIRSRFIIYRSENPNLKHLEKYTTYE